MADRSITIRIGANVTGLVGSLKTAQRAAQDFGAKTNDYIGRNQQSITHLSNTVGVLGLAMTGMAAVAVKRFADFDAAMSSVQASTMETAANMGMLREAALDAGARTVYSATEAAGAIEELAKAGVSTADILAGGLDGALDLAAAGEIGVAEAAETAASAMTQFGMSGRDVTHIADLLAAGAGKAQGGVSDMGQALNQAGLVASQMGLSIEETVGSLALFAKAGLVGSDAGTSFRAMLLRLANPTKESAELMAELGINAYDAQGNFVGMVDLAAQLETQLGTLTQAERNQALAQIFGQDAIRTSAILYEKGAEGVREWTAAVDEQGYAAEVAALRMDNLKGDVEEFTGSLETAFIGMGESADGPLRGLVQGATEAVNRFSELPPAAQGATMAIVGGGGLVLLGVAGLGKLAVATNETITALKEMGVISQTTGAKVGGIATGLAKVAGVAVGVAATAAATGALVDALTTGEAVVGANEMARALDDVVSSGGDLARLDVAFENTGTFLGMARTEADSFALALGQLANPSVTDRISSFFGTFPGVTSYMEILEERAAGVDAALSAMVTEGDVQGVVEFQDALIGAGFSAEEINRLLPATRDALVGAEDAAEGAAGGQDAFASATGGATGAVEDQVTALQEVLDLQRDLAGVVLSEREAMRGFEAAVDGVTDALEANGQGMDRSTEAGRANEQALDDVAGAGWDLIDAMRANGATQEELQGTMANTRQRFLDAAEAMGIGAEDANALADELNLIPENVAVQVDVETAQAEARLAAFRARLAIPDVVVGVDVERSGYYANRAQGGIVYGPGTATSDSIPARLSNGEYVIKAAAVSRYGKSMFDDLNAMRFATGGYVTAPSVPVVNVTAPAAPAGGGGVSVGQIVTADPRAAVHELDAMIRFSMAGWGDS